MHTLCPASSELLNAAAVRADPRLNDAAGRADSRLNDAAGRADSRLNDAAVRADSRPNDAAVRADSRPNDAAGRADSRPNAAAGRADSRPNDAAGRADGRTGPWCSSRGLVWAALSTGDPLQRRYLHTLRQGSIATAVFTHATAGIDCNSVIHTRYNRGPLQQHYLHTLRQECAATAVFRPTHVTTRVNCKNKTTVFTPVTSRVTVEISEDITLRLGKLWVLRLLRLSIVLTQMVSPVVWMKVVVFRSSSMLPHNCSCSVAPWDHCCVLAFLKRRQNCRMCSGD